MNRSRLLPVVVLLGALVLAGCDEDPEKAAPAPSTTPVTAPSTAAPTLRLAYEPGRALRLGTRASEVVLGPESATFLFTDRGSGPTDRIGSVDLTTGKRTELARTAFPGGSIVAVVRAGNEVVYVDESARGNRDPGAARWRIVVLRSGEVLASSGDSRVTQSPDLITIDGAAVWTIYPEEGSDDYQAFGWKPGGEVERREVLPGDELECTPNASDPVLVGGCDQLGPWIVWVEHGPGAAQNDFTEPAHLFYSSRTAGAPRPLGEVSPDGGDPLILGDYVLWAGDARLTVTSLKHPTASVAAVPAGSGASVSTYRRNDGKAVAVVLQDGTSTRLQVIDVSRLRLTSAP